MAAIDTRDLPRGVDGPSLVAAAGALMLLPQNASHLIQLHRLAAVGMALSDRGMPPASPSAVRALLHRKDIGGPDIQRLEDPHSEVLVQSVNFVGGPYLVSSGICEHAVADLEDLIDAVFQDRRDSLRGPARQLIQGLLTVSDLVLKRAGLKRGTRPGPVWGRSVDVSSSVRLKELADAAFISNDDLDAHGDWLRMVVDTFAVDPGQLLRPCSSDITDDRLHITPFLRLSKGYQLALPLDLTITMKFHLLRFALQDSQMRELGERLRDAVFRRFVRALTPGSSPTLLKPDGMLSRYLISVDGRRDLHVVVATDPLADWNMDVWGYRDTGPELERLAELISPASRRTYSSADELVHVVLIDSPGRSASWGVPNIAGADPVIIARADDLEVILQQENPDGPAGLFLFAQAIERRPGQAITTGILDEYCAYAESEQSFYLSDDGVPTTIVFQTGDGLYTRQLHFDETDRHGVATPPPNSAIIQIRRRYARDAPEIFLADFYSSYLGFVVELDTLTVFITLDRDQPEIVGPEPEILEAVAYWVRECSLDAVARPALRAAASTEIVLALLDRESWTGGETLTGTDPAVRITSTPAGHRIELTHTFSALLQEPANIAERELVRLLLVHLFEMASTEASLAVDRVAPLGEKRMLRALNVNTSPDMRASGLPLPLTGHDQVMARVLDELGDWLRAPDGGAFSTGELLGAERVGVLNSAVAYLFGRLESEVAVCEGRHLLDFLILQNESLVHDAKFNAISLRSRLACFGEQSHTVTELVDHRKDSATAQRANRFLIEYVAARPPSGERRIETLDYHHILAIATEIVQRGTTSDFLKYGLADFEVSILGSGRLGVSRDEPLTKAIDTYATNSGLRSVRAAVRLQESGAEDDFDVTAFVSRSEGAMKAEFGFTLHDLREVCGGLLDLAGDNQVTRIDRLQATSRLSAQRNMSSEVIAVVLDGITLIERDSFLAIGPDAYPWRFNRDKSYVRRPIVQQGTELVFGFRGIYRLGPYWIDNMLSGRLQGRARTNEMRRCISEARGRINDAFAQSVATKLRGFGMTALSSVNKIGKRRIVDDGGHDLGDVDVLALHSESRSIIAVEAKDFEIARTPIEIAGELEKLFSGKRGKKPTIELHERRVDWLRHHVDDVLLHMGADGVASEWRVVGIVVTSDPLLTPLVAASRLPVIAIEDLDLKTLRLPTRPLRRREKLRWSKRRSR